MILVDHPFVSSSLLNDLIVTQRETGKPGVTCQHETAIGPPALFHKTIPSELLQLKVMTGPGR
jgi:CTP:molybdopterin cytidylyltransferase MocA